jgi:hypothetical protein
MAKPHAAKIYGREKKKLHAFLPISIQDGDGQLQTEDGPGYCENKIVLLLSGIERLFSTPQPVMLLRQSNRRCV